jgi:hypothetical protein
MIPTFRIDETIKYDRELGEVQVLVDGAVRETMHVRTALAEGVLLEAIVGELRRRGYAVTPPPAGQRPQAVTEDYADDYETLRDLVIDLLNPPDGDDGEAFILSNAITAAARFVDEQPCACTPERIEDCDPCRRCSILGRLGNTRVER